MDGHGYEASPAFLAQLEKLQKSWPKIDEFLITVENLLNKNHDKPGTLVSRPGQVKVWKTGSIKSPGLPALNVYYSFVDGKVVYLGIKLTPTETNGATAH